MLIDLHEEEGKGSITYFLASSGAGVCEEQVFHSKEEAEELAKRMSKDAYNEAAFRTGNEQVKDYDEYVQRINSNAFKRRDV